MDLLGRGEQRRTAPALSVLIAIFFEIRPTVPELEKSVGKSQGDTAIYYRNDVVLWTSVQLQ